VQYTRTELLVISLDEALGGGGSPKGQLQYIDGGFNLSAQ
jgi:hypothetical protein